MARKTKHYYTFSQAWKDRANQEVTKYYIFWAPRAEHFRSPQFSSDFVRGKCSTINDEPNYSPQVN